MIWNIFKKSSISLEEVIEYIEGDLNIVLSHESVDSKYYRLGEVYIRISNHFQDKSKKCVGVTVIDGTAFIHVFNKVISTKSIKEVKQFLWNLTSFYGEDQFNTVYEATFKVFKKQNEEYLSKLKELHTQLSGINNKCLKQTIKISSLQNDIKEKEKVINSLNNQTTSLQKQIAYLNKLSVEKVKKPANLYNIRKKHTDDTTTQLIYDISEYLDKLPIELQEKILNFIGDGL